MHPNGHKKWILLSCLFHLAGAFILLNRDSSPPDSCILSVLVTEKSLPPEKEITDVDIINPIDYGGVEPVGGEVRQNQESGRLNELTDIEGDFEDSESFSEANDDVTAKETEIDGDQSSDADNREAPEAEKEDSEGQMVASYAVSFKSTDEIHKLLNTGQVVLIAEMQKASENHTFLMKDPVAAPRDFALIDEQKLIKYAAERVIPLPECSYTRSITDFLRNKYGEDFSKIDCSIYVSHALDRAILKAQKSAALKMGISLSDIESTEGHFEISSSDKIAFIVDRVVLNDNISE